jgi:uncharacterized protein
MSLRSAFRSLFSAALVAALPMSALAECAGKNLLIGLADDDRSRLGALTEAVPFSSGNFWRATRDGQEVVIAGTYHFDDPRHEDSIALLRPHVDRAATLLVEAGPEEEAALLAHMGRDPSILTITSGPSLIDRLPEDTWTDLSEALTERGIPPFMAAKFQPWYINILLAIPPCAISTTAQPRGLDGALMDAAARSKVDIKALEPYDTVLKLFGSMTDAEQVEMIEASLALDHRAEDFTRTLADAYFDGDSWLAFELMRDLSYDLSGMTREKVDEDFARMKETLMFARNRAWIPVIETAAAEGPVVAGFGALHLPGDDGVLALLERSGWTIAPLSAP